MSSFSIKSIFSKPRSFLIIFFLSSFFRLLKLVSSFCEANSVCKKASLLILIRFTIEVVTSFAPVVTSSSALKNLALALRVFPLNSLLTL